MARSAAWETLTPCLESSFVSVSAAASILPSGMPLHRIVLLASAPIFGQIRDLARTSPLLTSPLPENDDIKRPSLPKVNRCSFKPNRPNFRALIVLEPLL